MNPLTNVKNINKLNEVELSTGLIHKKSWHDMYKGSAWIFIGGLEYGLTEGDVITVFSQYGEVVNINLVRDKKSGKSKGYCFLCFANQKSTVLAVDNLNGIKLCNRTIRVDHVADYKPPKEDERDDEITKMLKTEGCAPKPNSLNESSVASNSNSLVKKKKSKKEKKKKKKKRKHGSDGDDSENDISGFPIVKVKKEKQDAGYDKYDTSLNANQSRTEKKNYPESKFENAGDVSRHSWGKTKSNQGQSAHERSNRREDESVSKSISKERSWYEREYIEKRKEFDKDEVRSMKREKRSSSLERRSSEKYENDVRHRNERRSPKGRRSDSKIRERREKYSSSSSNDSSGGESSFSSEDERNRVGNRNPICDHPKRCNEKKKENREGHRHVHQSKTDAYASGKMHYNDKERYSDYRTKERYESNDRLDSRNRDSNSKYKYSKR